MECNGVGTFSKANTIPNSDFWSMDVLALGRNHGTPTNGAMKMEDYGSLRLKREKYCQNMRADVGRYSFDRNSLSRNFNPSEMPEKGIDGTFPLQRGGGKRGGSRKNDTRAGLLLGLS